MLENLFEFLFKLRPIQFGEGNIAFQAGDVIYVFWLLLCISIIGFLIVYRRTNIYARGRTRIISIGLRVLALLLLCLPFLEPALLIPDVIPNENFLAVMVDNSASMDIGDGYFGSSRYEDAQRILVEPEEGIYSELEKSFNIRFYEFSKGASRVDSLAKLQPDGRETNLSASLQRVLSDFKGLPLASIVIFSDGGDNSSDDPRSVAEEIRSLDIPLHIVGVGSETLEQDRELLEVKTNKGLQEGSGAEIEVKVRSWTEEVDPVDVNIYDGENLVFTKKVNLKGNGKIDHFSFFFDPDKKGAVEYSLSITSLPGEKNLANNSLNMLLDSRKDTVRVLYFEGHLRTEFKFIKRALDDDQVVDFTSVSRTGTGKYYRQGIHTAEELSGGFPNTEGDLFRFKALIFGDIEASYFSMEQLELVEKLVRKRGGGFLMLGGMKSFTEGDYWNTPIADLLPVELDPQRRSAIQPDFNNPGIPEVEWGFEFRPTAAGLENPILKLLPDLSRNRTMWAEIPHLFSINYFGDVKPGATVLAVKPEDRYGQAEPLLVIQRYGKGRTAALASASTWRWQMLQDAKNSNHERFWRQFVRWLGTDAPGKVDVELSQERFPPGDEFPIRVSVYDDKYDPLNFADVTGTITDPRGEIHAVQFLPELTEEGSYSSAFVPQEPGVYTLALTAEQNGRAIGRQQQSFISRASKKEFYNATLKRAFLEDLAELTNGVYYQPSQFEAIPENLKTRKTSTSILRSEYIWDLPLLFIFIVVLLSAEWIYRRYKGLP